MSQQRRSMRHWQIRYLDLAVIAPGKTAGAACRWAFRKWIADGAITKVPATSSEGGWVGVTVTILPTTGTAT